MIGILYKEEEGYYVFLNTVILGTTRPLLNFDLVKYKLSLHNCEEIERDVPKNDLDGWDVEIEMENYVKYVSKSLETVYPTGGVRPKLDEDDCLILTKNIIQPQ
jgi:hypothetical protein